MNKAEPCPICESLGETLFVDFDEDERFPEGFYKLEMVQWFSEAHDLRRCPQCGAYYYFTFETDNDIFCPTHTGEYKRIPGEEAERMLQEYKARLEERRKEYRKQVRKLHGKVIRTLPETEKRIVEYLTDRLYDETCAEDISKDLGIDIAVVEKALESLKEKRVVEEFSYTKELVEKRGFSESFMKYHIRRT
ncbi:MAG: hypothetical protein KIH08_16810 [Candidatus Freyarchaeota archaeon]|nr:hypothetical protein [Candidatus Jordarchaeia archaeon]MBS7270277.1 hypothetical protein [Candidatus Jordarchaeia archaeon]MBS7281012.1 hypothetical protein [Candidatus Jordarchaeia archaeon]